jgi:hypothetical protein
MEFLSTLNPGQASKPTLFELVAQENLQTLLSPALRSVIAVRYFIKPRRKIIIAHNNISDGKTFLVYLNETMVDCSNMPYDTLDICFGWCNTMTSGLLCSIGWCSINT